MNYIAWAEAAIVVLLVILALLFGLRWIVLEELRQRMAGYDKAIDQLIALSRLHGYQSGYREAEVDRQKLLAEIAERRGEHSEKISE